MAIQDQYGVLKVRPQRKLKGPRTRDVGSNDRAEHRGGGALARELAHHHGGGKTFTDCYRQVFHLFE
ncbi:hypothetical protein D3C73_1495260 [compost metagenome]